MRTQVSGGSLRSSATGEPIPRRRSCVLPDAAVQECELEFGVLSADDRQVVRQRLEDPPGRQVGTAGRTIER